MKHTIAKTSIPLLPMLHPASREATLSQWPTSSDDCHESVSARRLLLLDDDPAVRRTVAMMGSRLGARVCTCTTVAEFETAIGAFDPHVLLIDLMMPDVDGIDVIARIAPDCGAAIYVMTGADKRTLEATREVLQSSGARIAGFLHKPFSAGDLRQVLDKLSFPELSVHAPTPIYDNADLLTPAAFARAAQGGGLEPFFQPIFHADAQRLKGFEALLRVTGESTNHFAAQYLDHLVQNEELAAFVTNIVIEKSLAFLAGLPATPGLTISINIFGTHAVADGFRDRLVAQCAHHNIAPQCVILELSEATVCEFNDDDLRKVTQLRLAGFGLSIDDFGTGNSSLGRLARLPFSELKIDKSFCLALPGSESAEAVIEACLGISRKLDMKVTAEGIESREIAVKLAEMGCHALQGHYFGQAMPARLAGEWISRGYPRP